MRGSLESVAMIVWFHVARWGHSTCGRAGYFLLTWSQALEEDDERIQNVWAVIRGKLCTRSPGFDGGSSTREHEHGFRGAR